MLGGLLFSFLRLLELVTLIPTIGMLSYFVNLYVMSNELTPNYILVLFIISVLAGAWALVTLFRRESVRRNAAFVAFIDLCFMGAFIAGAYFLRGVTNTDCLSATGGFSTSGGVSSNGNTININPIDIDYSPFSINANKTCTMLKASFAFGIMNCIFFFNSAIMAMLLHRRERAVVVEKTTYRRSSHGSRRGHSSHSGHRRSSRDSRRNVYV